MSMEPAEYDRLRSAFLKSFASVPDTLRDQIIAVIDGKPFTWESTFVEIKEGTPNAKKILSELKKLGIIK